MSKLQLLLDQSVTNIPFIKLFMKIVETEVVLEPPPLPPPPIGRGVAQWWECRMACGGAGQIPYFGKKNSPYSTACLPLLLKACYGMAGEEGSCNPLCLNLLHILWPIVWS